MSKLNSKYFHVIIEKYDKLNQKEVSAVQIKSMLEDLPSIEEYSFILHDKDKKREHYHINIRLSTAHQGDSILHSIAGDLMININCIGVKCTNPNGFYRFQRYLMHLDNPEKHIYGLDEVWSSDTDKLLQCIDGKNPYVLDIDYIRWLCNACDSIGQVYQNLGLGISNSYRNIIKDIRQEEINKL